jgi:hypothetical protein
LNVALTTLPPGYTQQTVFNNPLSTMDLLMVVSLLSFSADTLMENRDMESIIYAPAAEAAAA